jgi:hypothetical protein
MNDFPMRQTFELGKIISAGVIMTSNKFFYFKILLNVKTTVDQMISNFYISQDVQYSIFPTPKGRKWQLINLNFIMHCTCNLCHREFDFFYTPCIVTNIQYAHAFLFAVAVKIENWLGGGSFSYIRVHRKQFISKGISRAQSKCMNMSPSYYWSTAATVCLLNLRFSLANSFRTTRHRLTIPDQCENSARYSYVGLFFLSNNTYLYAHLEEACCNGTLTSQCNSNCLSLDLHTKKLRHIL